MFSMHERLPDVEEGWVEEVSEHTRFARLFVRGTSATSRTAGTTGMMVTNGRALIGRRKSVERKIGSARGTELWITTGGIVGIKVGIGI